jgi:hypothetical protein
MLRSGRRLIRPLVIAAASLILAAPALATIVNTGGGTWNYGSTYSFPVDMYVWSDYVNPTYYHSATTICGPLVQTHYNVAYRWASTNETCFGGDSDDVYWDNC